MNFSKIFCLIHLCSLLTWFLLGSYAHCWGFLWSYVGSSAWCSFESDVTIRAKFTGYLHILFFVSSSTFNFFSTLIFFPQLKFSIPILNIGKVFCARCIPRINPKKILVAISCFPEGMIFFTVPQSRRSPPEMRLRRALLDSIDPFRH